MGIWGIMDRRKMNHNEIMVLGIYKSKQLISLLSIMNICAFRNINKIAFYSFLNVSVNFLFSEQHVP